LKPEHKFYQEIKKSWTNIQFNRIENLSLPGIPDVLCYNKNNTFFTLELKVTNSNKIRLSPHQIAFHVKHPKNTFIIVKHLVSRDVKLYEGKDVQELAACGFKLEACCSELAACCLFLQELGA
jgi:hypothetical protein